MGLKALATRTTVQEVDAGALVTTDPGGASGPEGLVSATAGLMNGAGSGLERIVGSSCGTVEPEILEDLKTCV